MKNEKKDSAPPKIKDGSTSAHQVKGCCLLFASILVACLILVITGIATIIILDTINLRGENFTLERHVERYKVACQFLWVDFKDWVSRKRSDEPSDENGSSF